MLLSDREASNRTYREIAAASGASIGTVQRVMEELTDIGQLEKRGKQRRLHRVRSLFDQWVEAYTLRLYPSLQLGEYWGERIHAHLDTGSAIEQYDAQWGGESAVALQSQYLRPGSLIVYAPATPAGLLSSWRLRRAETEGNVFVRQRFWGRSTFPGPFVPSTLVYADLVASGDARQNEAASRLRANDALLRYVDSA